MHLFSGLLIAIFVVWTAISCNCDPVNNDNLKSVLVFFRHGDRSPKESYPNDPYFNISYWPMGFGQLTNQGIERHYQLGKWFRNRYNTFLPETYSADDIYAFSTDKDRTLMSAAANLAGLYPPKSDQIWDATLQWRPIPVHTIPRDIDTIIMDKRDCAAYTKKYKEVKKSKYFKELNANYSELYEFLTNETGMHVKDINDIKTIQSTFYAYETENKSFIPAWGEEYKDTLVYLSGAAYERHTHTKKLKKFMAGPFLYNLISLFEKNINQTEGTPKFFMISAHDTSLVQILNTLGIFDYNPPTFAAALIFELRERAENDYYVNILYKRDELENSVLEGCDFDCDFEHFKQILEPYTLDLATWLEECDK